MSRALLLYGLFILVALGLLYWRFSKLHQGPRTIEDVRALDDRPRQKPEPLERPFPYDQSGQVAAFRLIKRGTGAASPDELLMWLKGSLSLVLDDDWTDGRPRFESVTLAREELHELMRELLDLAELPASDFRLVQIDETGATEERAVDGARLQTLLEARVAEKSAREFRPPALILRARKPTSPGEASEWPLLRTGLKEILESERTVLTRHADIDKMLAVGKTSERFQQASLEALVTIEVQPDRP